MKRWASFKVSSKGRAHLSPGFTIVELLIVIVVIAVLAAVTVVAYNGVQDRANDAAVQSDLSSIAKKIKVFSITNGRYPQGFTDLVNTDLRVTRAAYSRGMFNGTSWYNLVYCWANSANPDHFALVAQAKSGAVYQYSGGAVTKAAYAFATSSNANCNNAGVDITTSGRDWFYDNDVWFSYAK